MRDVVGEIDALIAQEQAETDLVASMQIDGVTYRHGSIAALYVPAIPVPWESVVMLEESPETFTGPYAFNEAAAKLIMIATDSDAL
jgi:hypothetical protein